ncbi:hypothetical protein [Bdellovibrio sp. HCB-162]|uniref:hypothetical protein n=1 Tax=Bdellovibrio sp. HCB-162 TaxID=3394234 RepID=UPI0039BC6CF2
MTKRILKRIRNFRVLSGLLITFLTILSFQNCAPQSQMCTSSGADCSTESASSSPSTDKGSVWGSRPGNGNSSGVGVGSGSGGSGSVNIGSSGSGGSATGGGGVSVGSGGSSGGTSSGGGGVTAGGSGSTTNTSFRFTKQPQSVSVIEGASFTIDATVSGGTYPYTYQWYKDNQAIGNGMGEYSSYFDTAYSYSKEGNYHIVVKDAKGQSIQSSIARVTVQEQAGNCPAGSYFTFTNATYDSGYGYFADYFDSPRGKYLLHQSYDTMNFLYQYRSYTKLYDYNVPSTLAYVAKTYISCRTEIPRIHTPTPNPSYDGDWGYGNRFNDNGYWTYQGAVNFECHNKRLKLISNTCKWVQNPNYNNGGGG